MSLRKIIYAGAAALSVAVATVGITRHTTLADSYMPVTVKDGNGSKELQVPAYNLLKVPPGNCTRYARMVAYDLFGKTFAHGDAWDRKYSDIVVDTLAGSKTLESLAENDILKPGMLVGVYNPHTTRVDQKDKHGNPADFTHTVVYLGLTPEGRAVVAEQYITQRRVRTEQELRESGLEPKAVFNAPNIQ